MGGMGGDSGGGQTAVEVMVPGNMVGLVIGKGGETIRQLQVGCRLTWGNVCLYKQGEKRSCIIDKPLFVLFKEKRWSQNGYNPRWQHPVGPWEAP